MTSVNSLGSSLYNANASQGNATQASDQTTTGKTQGAGQKLPPPKGGGHPPKKAGGQADQSVQAIIDAGDSASVSDIQLALSGMSSSDSNYATLQSMLQAAMLRQQQQQPNVAGGALNLIM